MTAAPADAAKPLDLPQAFLPDIFDGHGRFRPEREAVVCGATRRTWGAFDAQMNRVANALRRNDVGGGHKVAVLMDNSVEMLEVLFGIVKAGACAVPLSGLLTGEQLARLVDDSDAVMVFASDAFRQRIQPHLPMLNKVRPDGLVAAPVGGGDGWAGFADFLHGAPSTMPAVRYAPEDDFNIIYSSGTTGLPKGIVQTHRARQHWAWSNAIEMGFTDDCRALTTTALYSNGTWLMMLPALFAGGTVVAMPAFDVEAFLDTVARERITHTFMVPAQYQMLLASPALERADLSSLRVMLCAGSTLRREVKRELIERLGNRLYELYGFSEGFATMLKPAMHERKFDTVGTPVLGFEVRIVDDAGRSLPRGEVGEIAGYGAGMMKGYHGRADATAALVWRDERDRTFLRSGDIGRLDEDGYLILVDRKRDMIVSGGFNVFPADIEAVVARHPAVLDVAVIAVAHPRWDEVPMAVVILRDGVEADPLQIQAFANERLAKHQRLHAVALRADLPRNALGKVLKRVLREEYADGEGKAS